MSAFGHKLLEFVSSQQLLWSILWLGLFVLTIGLLVLMRTRWGQSQPLGKCAALSLLAHLLFAGYATTVQIVSAAAGPTNEPVFDVTFVDSGEVYEDPTDMDSSGREKKIWEQLPTSEPTIDSPDLARAEPMPPMVQPIQSDTTTVLPITSEVVLPPVKVPEADTTGLIAADSSEKGPAAAEPIDQIPAPQSDRPAPDDVALPESPRAESKASQAAPDGTPVSPAAPQIDLPSPLPSSDNGQMIEASRSNGIDDPSGTTSRQPVALESLAPPQVGDGQDTAKSQGQQSASGGDPDNIPLVAIAPGINHSAELPEIYKLRGSADKVGVAKSQGGSPATEAAVQAALRWLAANQSEDGHWDASDHGAGVESAVLGHHRAGAGANADTGMTGLALLAFLGAGHTHRSGPYAKNVQYGLEYLLTSQAEDGNLGGNAELYAFMYCHGIATLALSEGYAMTGDQRMESGVRAAIGYTVAAQHLGTGSWRYQKVEPGDTSQLGWQLMALKSAELAGIEIPARTRDGMNRFLKNVSSGRSGGLAGYRPGERATRPMTAEALVCRQFLGISRDNPSSDEAGQFLLGELPAVEGRPNLYYWYYGTLGMYQMQGDYWKEWNQALQAALVERQTTTGAAAGSWEPDCIWGGHGGRVYSTAMAALCLEVYYRFLPLYGDQPDATVLRK